MAAVESREAPPEWLVYDELVAEVKEHRAELPVLRELLGRTLPYLEVGGADGVRLAAEIRDMGIEVPA